MNHKTLSDLKKRILTSSITIVVVSLLIYFSSKPFVSVLVMLATASLAAIAIWEYTRLAIAKDLRPPSSLMMFIGVLIVVSFFLSLQYVPWPYFPIAVLAAGLVLFFMVHFRDPEDALYHVAVEFFGVCYVAVPLAFLLSILYYPAQAEVPQDGRWWLAYTLLVTKITDVGAYFVGRLWGKHKLAPLLSPKKTVEGAIAGFLCAIIASYVMYFLGLNVSNGAFSLTCLEALGLGCSVGILAQISDLSESLLKRDAVVKDSNKLPGLGGILDMIDSLLLTSPLIYLFLKAKL